MATDFNELFNQGWAHFRAAEYTKAQAVFESLTADVPHPDAMRWLGASLQAQHKFLEAIKVYNALNSIEPNTGSAHCGLAVCYDYIGNSRLAGYHYDRAMKLAPHIPDMRWNRALHLLANGRYAEGWQDYKWGYMVPGCRVRRTVDPEWDGRPILAGQTLFVWAEQGFGDAIQFSRYLKLVRERVGPDVFIKFECPDELLPVFANNVFVDELISRQIDFAIPGGFDHHVSLMSLPALFGTTIDTVPWDGPYIQADAAKVTAWKAVIDAKAGDTLKVGVVWRGAAGHNNDAKRSMTLEDIGNLAGLDGVTMFGMNKGAEAFPFGPDLAPQIQDFSDTAAIIAALDLVITVDTAVAHLAGAMANRVELVSKVWIMLPQRAEWRWFGNEHDRSPWYPSAHLYRCESGGWQGLTKTLREHVNASAIHKKANE